MQPPHIMERGMRGIVVLVGLVGFLPMGGHAQLAKPLTDKTPSGIPRVMSPGPTAWRDTLGWKLVLDHVVQPKEGTPGELGKPDEIALLPDGRLYVVDESPSRIQLYDAAGRFVRTIGHEGAGPGEYRQPFLSAMRERLLVQDPEQSRVSLFTLDGKFLRSFPSTCCNFGPPAMLDDRGRISTAGFSMTGSKGHSAWIFFDTLGRRVDSVPFPEPLPPLIWTVVSGTGSTTYSVPLAPVNRNLRLPDGTLLYGRTDRYEFNVTRNGHDTIRVFGRTNVSAVPIPAAYRDSIFHARTDRLVASGAKVSESAIPTSFELWRDMNLDGAGNLWVATGGPRRGPSRFDVFTPAGVFLGSVPAPWNPGLRTSWAGDRVAVNDTDENDLPRVRVFRIVQK